LDATERLLVDVGYAGLSSRRITDEARQAHGSIRYHFGTLERLILAVVDRQTERLTTRQREMYASPEPFSVKWQQAMSWFEEDLASGYPKLVAELRGASWNNPAYRPGIQRVIDEWSAVLGHAVAGASLQLDLDLDDETVRGITGLIRTSQQAMLDDRLAGIDTDHRSIVTVVARLLEDLERRASVPDATTV
jgi:TetR/AcrR family transcriptional regulator